jgi:hypothetical protein
VTGHTVAIATGGKSVTVPALAINGKTVVVTGRWIKTAAIYDEDWIEGVHDDLESSLSTLKQHNARSLRADIFTVTQGVADATRPYSYHVEWDSVAAIRLTTFEDWWTNQLSGDARKDIRKAAKLGVVVKVTDFTDEFVQGIVGIYNESPVRQGKAFWHYQKDFDTVKRENSTYLERSTFIGAYFQDELIGFIKFVSVGRVAAMMQILTKISHYDKRPSNALIAKAVEHCAKTGMSCLTYGKYRERNKGTSSLGRFKHRMRFEEVRIPKIYVSLTFKGRICLALGLHRDLVTLLPESLIDRLYRMRTVWGRWRVRARRNGDPGREE